MLLSYAVREGATNVLRHAQARECSIRAVRGGGQLELELRNDGAAGSRAPGGTGLPGLADRLAVRGGVADATMLPSGQFVLRAENKAYAPIRPEGSLEIFGVMVGLVRKL
jgi:two-component system sensor histidine kinase DesK